MRCDAWPCRAILPVQRVIRRCHHIGQGGTTRGPGSGRPLPWRRTGSRATNGWRGIMETSDSPSRPAPGIPRAAASGSLFRLVVPPIILPVFLSAADGTVVATALPAIAASFGEVANLSWIVVANLIASTIAAPAYGRLGDQFGRRRMMVIALSLFMVASGLCAIAPSFWFLLTARILQGLGAGGLMTLAQALLGEHVPPRQRGSYQGYLSANIVAGSTIGPVAGGFVTQAWGWHAVFLAYLPLGLVAILLILRLPRGQVSGRHGGFDA